MGALTRVFQRGRALPWALILAIATELWRNARDRVRENLSERERREFVDIMRASRARPANLTARERDRFTMLVKKAATGEGDSSWSEVGRSLASLVPGRAVTALSRARGRR